MSRSGAIGIAVVGAGGWGKNHVRNYAAIPDADLRYICDRHEGIRESMAALYPTVDVVSDLRVILEDSAVAAIVVATHAPSHFEVAEAALRAGRDVFVEKPLCSSGDQAATLCRLAEESGRILMVGHLLLYHPAVERHARMAHIHVGWLDPHKTRKLTVVGDRKMALFDDTSADQKLAVFDKGVEPPATLSYEEGVRIRTGDILIPALKMAELLRRECLAFLEAVRTRKAPVADGASGLHVVRALEGGSAYPAEKGARIELPGRR